LNTFKRSRLQRLDDAQTSGSPPVACVTNATQGRVHQSLTAKRYPWPEIKRVASRFGSSSASKSPSHRRFKGLWR